MRTVCVFCGSSPGFDAAFIDGARALGGAIAATGRTLVYGGAKVGLMGAIADSVLAGGGTVTGVIPKSLLDKEVAHQGLTELHVVSSMHERKMMMAERSEAFIAMPGGLGTLEELFEVWTWAQLGLHQKPIGLFGPKPFFAPLLAYLDSLVVQGFVRLEHRQMVSVEEDPNVLLARLEAYQPPSVQKWIERSGT
jgi:uncharacterized protein (TIGR00730 family)